LYRCLIFDLDGTLTDPKTGIVRCVNYALKSSSLPEIDESQDDYSWLVGPPIRENFRKLLGRDAEDSLIERLVASYRKRFETIGMFENSLYPGIKELLTELVKNGERKLIVGTTKPTIYAKKIVEHFGLDKAFDFIIGSELDGTRSEKEELIRHAIEHSLSKDLVSYLMIGDRSYDIIGARRVGIDSVGVLYGYGTESEIVGSKPTFIARSVQELGSLLKTD
jgi:phosphoglycolate phosphatase